MTWIALVFCITLCGIVIVSSSWLLLFTEQWCISVVFTVQKTSLSEVKLFGHVSIIMVYSYIFNLFHVVMAVYNEGSGFYFENIQHCK